MKNNLNKIKSLTPLEKKALGKLLKELAAHWQDNLLSVLLHGSKSRRGKANPESDIDLLLIFKQIDNYREINRYLSKIESRLCLDLGPLISSTFVSEEYYRKASSTPFIKNVARNGIELWRN